MSDGYTDLNDNDNNNNNNETIIKLLVSVKPKNILLFILTYWRHVSVV